MTGPLTNDNTGSLLQTLQLLLEQELQAASTLLQDIRALREGLLQTLGVPDLAAGLPHHTQLQQLQSLARQRQQLTTALANTPLPEPIPALSGQLGALAQQLLEENTALGQALQLRLLFFRRLLQPVGEVAGAGVYARDGNLQASLATRKLDTI